LIVNLLEDKHLEYRKHHIKSSGCYNGDFLISNYELAHGRAGGPHDEDQAKDDLIFVV
jgi:hypothetical protein